MAGSKGESAWISDGVSYPGIDIRRDLSPLLGNGTTRAFGARSGRRRGAGGIPTISGITVSIPPGAAVVDSQTSGTDAPFLVSWTSAGTLPGTPADSSNGRVDIVYVRVVEVLGSPTTQTVTFGYQAGTASSSPVPPTTLSDSTPVSRVAVLGYVNVPASGGGSATVTPGPEVSAAGGKFYASRDADYPANPAIGDQVFDSRLTYSQTWLSNSGSGYWSPDALTYRERFRSGFTAGGTGLDIYDEITANDGEVRIIQQETWVNAAPGTYRITAKVPIAHPATPNPNAFGSHLRLLVGAATGTPSAIVSGGTGLGIAEPVDVPAFKTQLFIQRNYAHGGGDLALTLALDSNGGGVNSRLYRGCVILMDRISA